MERLTADEIKQIIFGERVLPATELEHLLYEILELRAALSLREEEEGQGWPNPTPEAIAAAEWCNAKLDRLAADQPEHAETWLRGKHTFQRKGVWVDNDEDARDRLEFSNEYMVKWAVSLGYDPSAQALPSLQEGGE